MISYGPGLVFPDAWGGRPEEELEDAQAKRELDEDNEYGICPGCAGIDCDVCDGTGEVA